MAFRLLAARRGLYVAGATTAAAACRYRVARLDEGEAAAPPKPPGIYKDADFDPSGIEDVAALAAQRLSKSDLQYKKQESLDKQAEEKKNARPSSRPRAGRRPSRRASPSARRQRRRGKKGRRNFKGEKPIKGN